MDDKVDLTLAAHQFFLNPWQDAGLSLLSAPDYIWREAPLGRIHGFAASAYPETTERITTILRNTRKSRRFETAIEYNTVPVVLDQAHFRKSYLFAGEKAVLSGAAGTRILNQYRWQQEQNVQDAEAEMDVYFRACRQTNENHDLQLNSVALDPDIDFAVCCRNTFNYFHFLSEALPQLTVLDGLDFQGNIYFHFPNPEDRQKPFALAFVEALFPEFSGRIFFDRAPKAYNRVLTAYDLSGGHFQAPDAWTKDLQSYFPQQVLERDRTMSLASRVTLAMNTVTGGLSALRRRALKAIEGQDFEHLPKRFFVGRDTRYSRARHMQGEDLLFDHLALFGFEYVVFESLSPLEQIAIMARAEVMLSYHGAGFANMLFAGPQTHVIEIGTVQTAQIRWGDFWPLAHASQCNYVSFFGDIKTSEGGLETKLNQVPIHPVFLSEAGIGQVMAFVVSLFGQYPQLETPQTVAQLARQLLQVLGPDQAIAVLDKHADMVARDTTLCLLKAECHKMRGEPKAELLALELAYELDPRHWRTIQRMIWSARRCERPAHMHWALRRLETHFPDRYATLLKKHEWLGFIG